MSWFQQGQPVKPPKKKKQPIPATMLVRCMNMVSKEQEAREQGMLYMGSVIKLSDPEYMKKALIAYWLPTPSSTSFEKEYYTRIGNVIEDIHVSRLHSLGLTYCDKEIHEEYKIKDEERGLSGRSDVILDIAKLKHYDKLGKNDKRLDSEDAPKPHFVVNEVKSTGSYYYKEWGFFERLPEDYLTQFSLYVKYLYERGITDTKEGFFTIYDRDKPTPKNLWGEMRQDLIDRAYENADNFWEYVRKRTFPGVGPTLNISWIETQIKNQPNRIWHKLGEVNV